MRIAVLADIHSNLEALEAVLERISGLHATGIVCLGDIVGYNANPNECIDLIKSSNITCVAGNHDVVACEREPPARFNQLARIAIEWTREQLTDVNRQFLMKLPRQQQVHDLMTFHGYIHDTDRYLFDANDARNNFQLLKGLAGDPWLGFFGHTHVRTVFSDENGATEAGPALEVSLSPANRYLINPGSVGQPRDLAPRASFLIYDADGSRITFHRVEYDIQTCQEKILRAGLPPRLAERLASAGLRGSQ